MTDIPLSEARVVLMVTTYAGVARFVPLVREALAEFWPEHPPLRFLTDGGADGADVWTGSERAFVPLMAEGIARLRAEFPKATHVLHMLEDHCPLRRCEQDRIDACVRAALDGHLAALVFVTYPWFWYYANETVEFSGERLIVLPKAYYRYFQVQPTLWRIDYLDTVLAASMRLGITDPWGFEALPSRDRKDGDPPLPEAQQHYISTYAWPTVHHGFLALGKIHDKAIAFADRNATSGLRRALVKEVVGIDSEVAYKLHRARSWAKGLAPRIRNRLASACK